MALLEVADLRTVFESEEGLVRAVDGVSFQVEAGRTLGIVGESGCGKSVSALSVLRLVPQPPGRIVGGTVRWKGQDLLALDADQMPRIRGQQIAMIFQDPMTSLNPVFTVRRQLGEVLRLRFGVRGAAAEQRMVQVLEHVGIADAAERLGQYPHELSGGMKQRVMIAMALVCRPGLLIADEPTTALDTTVQLQILELMKRLQQEYGMAIVLITHAMGVVAETCDDVVVMYAGKVVESCGIYSLFEQPRHPYTRGLLDCIVRPGSSKARGVPTIEGLVPSLLDPPPGCRFAGRCARAQNRCRAEEPPLAPVGQGHLAACHFPLEPGA